MNNAKALPLERCVDCSCEDYRLAQPVLLYNRWGEQHVYACMRCGAIECVHPMGDEPRGGRPPSGANFVMNLTPEVREWLNLWPRLLTLGCHSNQPLWSPADVRLETWADIQDAISRAEAEQTRMSPAERLLDCFALQRELPTAPPPASLPDYLRMYRMIWSQIIDPRGLAEILTLSGCTR